MRHFLNYILPFYYIVHVNCYSQELSILINNSPRTFSITIPSTYSSSNKIPLVIVLHDSNNDIDNIGTYTGFDDKAKKEDFIAVYPRATKNENNYYIWNAGNIYSDWTHQVNDIVFIDSLIKYMKSSYNIDSKKIYVAGYSNGAMMAYRIAAELSDKITAVACVAGPMVDTIAKPNCPVAVLHIHGDEDLVVPHTGTQQYGFQMAAIDEVLKKWLTWDSCSTVPTVLKYDPMVTALRWKGKADVRLYLLHGFGHDWPSKQRGGWPATDIIWDFFKSEKKDTVH